MYMPRHFEQGDASAIAALVRAHPLAIVVTHGDDGLSADHVPLEHDAQAGVLRGHVARANPMWQRSDGRPVLAVFRGPEAYVTPSAYPSKVEHQRVVPTWNYAVVHAHGTLRAVQDADWLHALVSRLTDRHESTRAHPWSVADAPADYVQTMLRAIVGIEITISRLQAKWKVSQNRSEADRLGVADVLAGHPMADFVRP